MTNEFWQRPFDLKSGGLMHLICSCKRLCLICLTGRKCPDGWIRGERNTCLKFVTASVTHQQAQAACKDQGATLATLNTEERNERVVDYLYDKYSSECQFIHFMYADIISIIYQSLYVIYCYTLMHGFQDKMCECNARLCNARLCNVSVSIPSNTSSVVFS